MNVELWGLTSEALEGETWRLWTGHLVHWDAGHLLLNLAAAVPPLLMLRPWQRRLLAGQLVLIAPLLSLLLLQIGGFDELRGASGLLASAWCIAALTQIRDGRMRAGLLFAALLAVKLLLDRVQAAPLASDAFAVSTVAHAGGTLVASLLVLAQLRLPESHATHIASIASEPVIARRAYRDHRVAP